MQPSMGHNLVNKYRNIVETEHIIEQTRPSMAGVPTS